MLSHRNLLANSESIRKCFGHTNESRGVIWLPPYHDMGLIGGLLQPLYVGFQVLLMSSTAFLRKPSRWLEAISEFQATTSGGPDFAYSLCAQRISLQERESLNLSSWRVAFTGAEHVRAETLEHFYAAFAASGFRRESFLPCYGLAEATLIVTGTKTRTPPTVTKVSRLDLERGLVRAAFLDSQERTLVGVGQGFPKHELRVIDPQTMTTSRPDQVGEIWVSGPSVARGYFGRPEETARTFQATLIDEPDRTFLRTGDLGFLRDGQLFIAGRLKDLIVVRGRNHSPEDIELTAEGSHRALRRGRGAAFSVTENGRELLVVAFEIERGHLSDTHADVANTIRAAVTQSHGLRVDVVMLLWPGSIPVTSSGKVQRHACRQRFQENSLRGIAISSLNSRDNLVPAEPDRPGVPPDSPSGLVGQLLTLTARAFACQPDELNIMQPLSAMGLDSLRAVQLQHAIEAEFRVLLPLAAILQDPSLEEVAQRITEATEMSSPVVTPPRGKAVASPPEVALSPGQRALWFMHRLSPLSGAYNIAGAARLNGDLDLAALGRSLLGLAGRHEVLRVTVSSHGGEPVPAPGTAAAPDLLVIPAESWSEDMLRERLADDADVPFDLARGPLLRLRVYRLGERHYALLLTAHHIVADLWSVALMLDELGARYAAECAGGRPVLDEPGQGYFAAVQDQLEHLAGPAGEALWRYWREELAGAPGLLELPADRPRPPAQTFRGARHSFAVSAVLAARLRLLGERQGATPYMVLLAAFLVLLHRHSGQDDLVVGSPTAGRARAAEDRTIGYFVNPVPLRSSLTPGMASTGSLTRCARPSSALSRTPSSRSRCWSTVSAAGAS